MKPLNITATNAIEMIPDGISRRRFLALLGASAAFASGAAGCSKIDRGTIVPYTRKPRDVVPGIANYYASTFQEGLTAFAVLVTTREGRPILIEGNDEHPDFKGKTSFRATADILRLYDPDRLQHPSIDGKPARWDEAEGRVLTALQEARITGKPLALFTGAVLSPTRRALLEDCKRVLPGLVHIPFEPTAPHAARAAARAAFGQALSCRYRIDCADVLVSFGQDFLGAESNAPIALREFATRRRVSAAQERMNRLWVFEGGLTVTGAKADHRCAIRPSRAAALAFGLARRLHEHYGIALPAGVAHDGLRAFDLDTSARELRIPPTLLYALADDLAKARQNALVLAGPTIPVEGHIAADLLNAMLGAEGHTAETASATAPVDVCTFEELRKHLIDMKAARYRAAIFWDVNPAYFYPNSNLWRAAIASVPTRISIGVHLDETAKACDVVLPAHHWLEAWGDYETCAGLLALQQPVIGPLYDSKQAEDVLLDIARALGGAVPPDYRTYLRARWQKEVFPAGSPVPFERFWNAALHDGVLRRSAAPRAARTLRAAAVEQAVTDAAAPSADGFEIELQPGSAIYDGRYANNGWLQELPDPITKVTWANPVAMSPADAEQLHLTDGDVVCLEAGKRSVEVPVLVQPGQARGVLSGTLGYGRDALSVAEGVGVNLYPLIDERSAAGLRSGAILKHTGTRVPLPLAQRHQTIEGHEVVRSISVAECGRENASDGREQDLPTLYPRHPAGEHKWAMVIDLSACVGCGSCIIACQAENNIPVVGPEQVLNGREMHWMRVDRYYQGEGEKLRVLHQPMLCQQCDDAPCENVCPVNATNHSPDGLSQMAYNRCVGTRYCANNCPFKVRRFNFLDFTGAKIPVERLVFNPEVTVRPRGVMEKCTFCVQRIEDARLRAKAEMRSIRDGDVVPTCASACGASAIVFGDLKDPESAVSKLTRSTRAYRVLAELGVRPSVTYLANVTNPVRNGGTDAV